MEPFPSITTKDIVRVILDEKRYAPLFAIADDINRHYDSWSSVKYKKIPEGFTSLELWTCVKASRLKIQQILWKHYDLKLSITTSMQQFCHQFDMYFGGSWGNDSIIPQESKTKYLISSLMEEAISSSKMEGAVTTRLIAKDMLRKKLSPKDKSQQMILNNYNTILYITQHRKEALTEELLLKIHALMTEKAMDNPEDSGRFRQNDNIVVGNAITGETVHTPPSYTEIPQFVKDLCEFFNADNQKYFIHPIIRAIIIHFMVAYVHPFTDGNGRTARALFYWYMLKHDYWLTEYLSISKIIAKSKTSYEKAYLFVESDEMDLGYFITYNLEVLNSAFENLKLYIQRKNNEQKAAQRFLKLGNINLRQAEILQLYVENPNAVYAIKDFQVKFMISPTTAKADITPLVERGILNEISLNKVKKSYIVGDNFESFTRE